MPELTSFELTFRTPIILMLPLEFEMIRELNDEFGYTTSILGDLQGPKLRVGVMKEDVVVSKGDNITFTTAEDILGNGSSVFT